MRNRKATTADFLIAGFLFLLVLAVVVPFINTIAISFSTQREYLNTPLLLIPRKPTLNNYINLLRDKRISIGYLTSLKILLLGLPINLFLTVSLAYGTSRKNYPGKRLILGAILFTMLFIVMNENQRIVPLVPPVNHIEQCKCCKNRFGNGKNNGEKNFPFTCSVQLRGFNQCFRQRTEIITCKHKIKYIDAARQYDRPNCIR